MSALSDEYGPTIYRRGTVYVQRRRHYARDGWHVMRVKSRGRDGHGHEEVIAVFASKRDAMEFAAMKQPKCRGEIRLHDDGCEFMCTGCGKTWRRTRENPMPDTTHQKEIR